MSSRCLPPCPARYLFQTGRRQLSCQRGRATCNRPLAISNRQLTILDTNILSDFLQRKYLNVAGLLCHFLSTDFARCAALIAFGHPA